MTERRSDYGPLSDYGKFRQWVKDLPPDRVLMTKEPDSCPLAIYLREECGLDGAEVYEEYCTWYEHFPDRWERHSLSLPPWAEELVFRVDGEGLEYTAITVTTLRSLVGIIEEEGYTS